MPRPAGMAAAVTASIHGLRTALLDAVEALEHLPLPVRPGSARAPLPANRRFSRASHTLDAVPRRARGYVEVARDLMGRIGALAELDREEFGPPAR